MCLGNKILGFPAKEVKDKMDDMFDKYRLYKYLLDEDSTGRVEYREYCERIERIVKKLPSVEQTLIHERYMTNESQYIKDYHVYDSILHIGNVTYIKLRNKAFERLYLTLFKPGSVKLE